MHGFGITGEKKRTLWTLYARNDGAGIDSLESAMLDGCVDIHVIIYGMPTIRDDIRYPDCLRYPDVQYIVTKFVRLKSFFL